MNLNKSRVLDAGRWRPPQRVIRVEVDDGRGGKRIEEQIERRPSQRHEMMLNPAGFVVPMVLGNANAIAEESVTPYAGQIRQRKMALGFLPWGRCPVAMVGAQLISSRLIKCDDVRNATPCTSGDFGPDKPCPHALAEKAYRAGVHEAKERGKAEAYKAEAERDREQREKHHEDLIKSQQEQAKALQSAFEALAGQRGDLKKSKGHGEG
jgi:hypothetical protein